VKSSILLTGTVKKIMFLGQRSWRDIESIESYVKTLPNDTICLVRAGFGFQDIVVDLCARYKLKSRRFRSERFAETSAFTKNALIEFLDAENEKHEPITDIALFYSDIQKTEFIIETVSNLDIQIYIGKPCTPSVISVFKDNYRFLSNMYACNIKYNGKLWRSVEHAYQASKFSDEETINLIREQQSPYVAKKLGAAAKLPSDWDAKKLSIMEDLVREKFKNPMLRELLLQTGDARIIEGNWWGDNFWGVCKGEGQNHLGKILMKIRAEIVAEDCD